MEEIQKKISEDPSQIYYIATDEKKNLLYYCMNDPSYYYGSLLPSWIPFSKNRILYRDGKYYCGVDDYSYENHELDIKKLLTYTGTIRIICKAPDDASLSLDKCFTQMGLLESNQPKFTEKQLGFYST